jgi:hypothetical protein
MLFSSLVTVTLASLMSVASAQSVYYPFNPEDLNIETKSIWCTNQISSCTLLCLDQQSGDGFTNDCNSETLEWQCICSDNTAPNATQYSQTIPYFICSYQVQNCVDNCGIGAPDCAQKCKTDKVCGATNPTRLTSSGSIKPATKTSTSTATGTNAPDDAAFDAATTSGADSAATDSAEDDTPSETASGSAQSTEKPNAGNRLSSVTGGVYAFSIMSFSLIFGAFVFQL